MNLKVMKIFGLSLILSIYSSNSSGSNSYEKLFKEYSENGESTFSGEINVYKSGLPVYKYNSSKYNETYRVGSITKVFTIYIINELISKNKLKLEDKVSDYIPGLESQIKNAKIIDLLNHTSGLKAVFPKPEYNYSGPEGISNFINNINIDFDDKKYLYNNFGYMILGLVSESIERKSWFDIVRTKIIDKYKLKNTGFGKSSVQGHSLVDGKLTIMDEYPIGYSYSSGSIFSNSSDLVKLVNSLISKKWFKALRKDYVDGRHFLGLEVLTSKNIKYFGHKGTLYGFSSSLLFSDNGDCVVSVLSNVRSIWVHALAVEFFNFCQFEKYDGFYFAKKNIKIPDDMKSSWLGEYNLSIESNEFIKSIFSDDLKNEISEIIVDIEDDYTLTVSYPRQNEVGKYNTKDGVVLYNSNDEVFLWKSDDILHFKSKGITITYNKKK
ncbi:hypothetical protein VNTUMSATTG_28370 [Vibrio nigripulchritudo]|uniref:serine hydrolase domain-containing protein n=1 Tax=Vibrio nigripulchritudo TaxID=28173 RepID=UPI00190A9691|nr:serine hydrolase domain-containing protein [Vibrio nigripulchritudo]BCL70900.1 hypothetical protein VNTUMSATTG_28370 [Vibrio nigripulchritudo]